MNWGLVWIYGLAVGPVLAVVVAALRPMRRGPALVAVYLAPILLVLLGAWTVAGPLGFFLASVLLLVAPVVPWRKPWARLAVPATVLAVALVLSAGWDWGPVLTFWINAVAVVAIGGLAVGVVGRFLLRMSGQRL